MANYRYARWVSDKLKGLEPEVAQQVRDKYYSDSGRIAHYDEYARFCRLFGYSYDDSPDGYWESKIQSWHKPTGYLLGLTGVISWFSLSLVTGFLGRKAK